MKKFFIFINLFIPSPRIAEPLRAAQVPAPAVVAGQCGGGLLHRQSEAPVPHLSHLPGHRLAVRQPHQGRGQDLLLGQTVTCFAIC